MNGIEFILFVCMFDKKGRFVDVFSSSADLFAFNDVVIVVGVEVMVYVNVGLCVVLKVI